MNLEKVYEILDKQATLLGAKIPNRQNGSCIEDELALGDWAIDYYQKKLGITLTEQDKQRVVYIETQGGEDCGSYYHIILKVRDDESGEEAYVKWVGHYDSWNGTDWYNDPEIVTPVKKIVEVTEWHTVK